MKLANSLLRTAGIAAVAAVLSGCSSTQTVNTVEPAVSTGESRMVSYKKVVTDKDLDQKVNVTAVNAVTAAGGHLKVQVEVKNLTDKLQKFTYRVEWFDAQGMIIRQPQASAISRSLEGRETAYITVVAPTADTKDYRIKLLEPVN